MTKKILFLGLLAGFANACFAAGSLKDGVDMIPMFVRVVNRIAPKDHACKPALQKIRDYNYYFNGEDDNKLKYCFDAYAWPHLVQIPLKVKDAGYTHSVGHAVVKPLVFLGIYEGIGKLSEVDINGQRIRAGHDDHVIAAGALTETLCYVVPEFFSQDNPDVVLARANQSRNAIMKKVIIGGAHKKVQPYNDSFIEKHVEEGFTREALKCVANIATMQVISMGVQVISNGVHSCIQK